MHDFTFNGVSLRSLGGRITEAPFHTVASRDVEQVKIYGQSVVTVASAIQEAVSSAVESMTGIKVVEVNVNVCGIARQ